MAICPQCHTQHPDDVRVCPHDGSVLMSDESLYATEVDLIAGQMVGEYQIEAKIGAGGFGTVYRAEQPLIGKQVAVKVLNRSYSSNPQMVSRFVAEARAVNQIRHRNIIDIFSFGVLPDKRQYFVMEYLDGMPFDEYIKSRGRLPIEEAIPILRQIAKALDAAHAAGIAHRDLKPENVFLAMDGDGAAYPKLLDFGIAKLLGESTTSGHKTRTGTPIGTPYYMSPEQCLGKGVDHRADIYSFGVMTHEVLTGKLPFDAEEMMTVMFKQMNAEPPAMSSVCPELLLALDGPVLRMLAKRPEERPSSVAEGVEALAQAARDAGLDVTVAPVWRPGATPPFSGMNTPGPMTPAEQLEIASAKTMAAADSGTLSASVATERTPSLETGKSKGPMIVGAGALVFAILAGIGGFFALRSPSDAASPSASVATPVTSTSERVAPSTPSETAPVEPAGSVAPAVPANVQLTIQSVPTSVEAYVGDEKLGSSPGPLKLPRSDNPVELTFKASGYHDKVISLVPKDDAIVSVNLARVSTGRAKPLATTKKTGSGEIENPF